MARQNIRSRSLRRSQKRTVSGTVARYTARKYGSTICAKCKKTLRGRKVKRIYGGYLCSNCTRLKLINEARAISFKKE